MTLMGSTDLDLGQLVESGTVRRIVVSALGRQIRATPGADEEDVIQAVMLRLAAAQRSSRAQYNAQRGYRPTTYVWMVARSAGLNALRKARRTLETESAHGLELSRTMEPQEGTADGALDRVLALLDLPEERVMATMLGQGHSLEEVRVKLGLSRSQASELRARVRALLLPLRDG